MTETLDFTGIRIGFAMTGSFCTFDAALTAAERLKQSGARLVPVMSENACSADTRFGEARAYVQRLEELCGAKIINTIAGAEPLGPGRLIDALLVCPCTGNTLAKLTNSITDTAVTMAVKSHIRNARPVVLCIATNDALAGSAKNIGKLLNFKHYYFVPFRQDDCREKPSSLVSDFSLVPETLKAALEGRQIQPIIL